MNAQLEEELLDEPRLAGSSERGYDSLSGTRKAAMLLISLGDQASAKIVSQLSDDEIQRVSKEVARIKSLSGDQVEGVLEEFYNLTLASDYVVSGGVDYARKMLVAAFGPEAGLRLLDKLPKDIKPNRNSWRASCNWSIRKLWPWCSPTWIPRNPLRC